MGLGSRGDNWAAQVEHFQNIPDVNFVVFDNRGCGQSSHTHSRYTTKQFARDTLELIDFLGWEKVHVVGVSMGGMISQEFALILGTDRLLSLVLVATHAGGWKVRTPWTGQKLYLSEYFAKTDEQRTAIYLQTLYSNATLKDKEKYDFYHNLSLSRLRTYGGACTKQALQSQTMAVMTHSVAAKQLNKFKEWNIPVLVMTGLSDVLVAPSNSKYLAKQTGGELLEFPDTGHGILRERASEVNEAIARHILRHSIS